MHFLTATPTELLISDGVKPGSNLHPRSPLASPFLTEFEWNSVLEVRFKAFKAFGKFEDAKSSLEMCDRFDEHSRQVFYRSPDRIISAVRIVGVFGNPSLSEHYQMKVPVPDWLWEQPFVEASRGCILPEFSGKGIYSQLIRHMFEVCRSQNIRYILGNCNENHWPMYRSLGFQETGVVFEAFGTKMCRLILLDLNIIPGPRRNNGTPSKP